MMMTIRLLREKKDWKKEEERRFFDFFLLFLLLLLSRAVKNTTSVCLIEQTQLSLSLSLSPLFLANAHKINNIIDNNNNSNGCSVL